MAMNNLSSVLLVALVMVFAAHAQDLGINSGLELEGMLYCTGNGNQVVGVQSSGVAGANVSLSCEQNTIASAVTNIQGSVNITANVSRSTVRNIFNGECVAIVDLPIPNSTCTLLPLSGELEANVSVANLVDDVLHLVTGLFQYVA